MQRAINPAEVGPPSANYSLATEVVNPTRMMYTSGIGPVGADGDVPEAMSDQVDMVWSTLLALLDDANFEVTDVVSVTTYVVIPSPDDGNTLSSRLATAMEGRDANLAGHRCASVLVPVPALATPSWKLEVAVVAAADE